MSGDGDVSRPTLPGLPDALPEGALAGGPGAPGGQASLFRRRPFRHVLLALLDAAIAAGSLMLALLLRFETAIPPAYLAVTPLFAGLLVAARLAANLLFRLHRWSFRLSGLTDAVRVVLAGLLGTGLFMTALFFLRIGYADDAPKGPPRSVVVLEFFLSTAAMGLVRFSPRLGWLYVLDRRRQRRSGALRTLIVGAGAAGDMLLRDLRQSSEHAYRVVGFVDDDRSKRSTILGGCPVMGGVADLPDLVVRHRIDVVLIAIPRLAPERIRQILNLCSNLKVRFKTLPVSFVYLNDRAATSMLQDLAPEDLLHREPVSFASSGVGAPLDRRTVLVTGAAGSIGSEISRQLLEARVGRLVMVDIDENNLYMLQRRFERTFPEADVAAVIGDVRDERRMQAVLTTHRPDDVFHAAAHKHVPLMESAPCEAIKNNVLGTRTVARAAAAVRADRFVLISTDKAVRPTSVMGASKRVAERLVQLLAEGSATRFCAVRFGNVLGSAGSVVPIFREQIQAGGPVTVTHPEVKRFFMTTAEAVGLVLAAAYGDYGTLLVLDMGEQIRILELARHMITMSGQVPDADVPIVFTGLRPGEKLSEELLTEEEERTSKVADRILVAAGAPSQPTLAAAIDALIGAAAAEDEARVMALLRAVVPSYAPQPAETSGAQTGWNVVGSP